MARRVLAALALGLGIIGLAAPAAADGEQIAQLSSNPVPRITTVVPPAVGPLFGVTEVMTGLARAVDAVRRNAMSQ